MKAVTTILLALTLGCAAQAQPKTVLVAAPPTPTEDYAIIVAQAPPKPVPAPKALATPAIAPLPPGGPDVPRGSGGAITWTGSGPFKYGMSSSSSSRRTLIIPKGDSNPEFLANADEDLNVMTVILEKALEQRNDEEGRKALGIDIFSGSSGIRNVLIEGYGVIFTLKTKIALVPPPAPKKEEIKNKETTSSEWEEAKRQIYGPSDIEKEIHKAFGKVQMNFNSNEDYDAEKVQRLKDSLIEALKSASNVRHLSGDNTVTVVVLSSSSIGEVHKMVTEAGRGSSDKRRVDVYAKADREAYSYDSRSGSRMMLQARKSDIDAYAKGNLTTDAFRDKVKIQVY